MKHKITPVIALLILTSWLVACRAATETPLPTATKPALPTSTGEPVEFVTGAPNTPTVAPTPVPPTATPTPPPAPTDTPVPETQPQPATLEGLIVFPVFDTAAGTYDIYSAELDGGGRALVVAEASQPTLNSDGGRIAFRSWKADNRGLIERSIEGDDEWRFNSFFEAARPAFSPDDQSFLFQSREAGEEFAIYRTAGTEYEVLRREAFPVQGEAPAWTPDGESLVYKGCLGDLCGLYKIDVDGSDPTQLTEDLSDINPAVSPDGETVVFMSESDGNWDIYLTGIDGSGRTQLTDHAAADGLPAWSPDGNTLAFVSERSGEWAIWAMNADGSNQRLLFELGGSIDGVVAVDVQNSYGWLEESIAWAP